MIRGILLAMRPRSTRLFYTATTLTLSTKYNQTIVFERIIDQSFDRVGQPCLRFAKIGDWLACLYRISGKSNAHSADAVAANPNAEQRWLGMVRCAKLPYGTLLYVAARTQP